MSTAFFQQLSHKNPSLRNFRYYDILVHIFVVVLLISNLVAQKICVIGPFQLSGAQLLFPLTYIFGDVFTEVYGYSGSRRAIWIGFSASALMALLGVAIVHIPAAPGWPNQQAFEVVFNFVPRVVAASLVAFWCGEFANSYTLAKMKLLTQGRWLWTRTVGSTVVGQAVDTILVMFLTFGGTVKIALILRLIFWGYLGKVIYEVVATPLTYAIVNFLKRTEGVDVYDTHTDFNPFSKEKKGERDVALVNAAVTAVGQD
jgi:hypothetical protein